MSVKKKWPQFRWSKNTKLNNKMIEIKQNGMQYKRTFDILINENVQTSSSTVKRTGLHLAKNRFFHKKKRFWSSKIYQRNELIKEYNLLLLETEKKTFTNLAKEFKTGDRKT